MIPEATSRRMADCTDYGPLDGLTASMPDAAKVDGVEFYKASSWMTGITHSPEGGKAIVLMNSLGDTGLMLGMTVEGARAMARSLTILADRVEAIAAGDAAAMVDALLAEGGRA